jgi:3-oxoacyl-[acyl-carrier-protein] synthase II
VSADAHHLTQPRPDGAGAVLALRRALGACGLSPDEIDYINAHGTGTPQNDPVETRAIKSVLGALASRVPVSSTKSMVGHTLGAAGAIEALACVLAIRGGFVPPTANLLDPDPECDLDYVPRDSRPARLRTVLSNSYGFGGNNTSIVLRAAA